MGTQERPPRGRPLATRRETLDFKDGGRVDRPRDGHVLQRALNARVAPMSDSQSPSGPPDAESRRAPRGGCAAPGIGPLPRNQLAMQRRMVSGVTERRHVSQPGASER
jgi:hypothetical protein